MVGATPGVYDGLHFAHLRTGSALAKAMDPGARARLVPALRADLDAAPAAPVRRVFATGTLAATALKAGASARCTVAPPFYAASSRDSVREALGLEPGAGCLLVINRDWDFRPLVGT